MPNGGNALISTEMLSADIERAPLDAFKTIAKTVKVVIYLRRQDAFAESAYCEKIKRTWTNPSIMHLCKLPEFSRRLKYDEVCAEWATQFGENNLIVHPYEDAQFKDNDLFADFLSLLGVSSADGFRRPPKALNRALSLPALEFKRLVNVLISDETLSRGFNRPLMTMSDSDGATARPSINLLSDAERRDLLEASRKGNAIVARTYLHRSDGRLFLDKATTARSPVTDRAVSDDELVRISERLRRHAPDLLLALVRAVETAANSDDHDRQAAAAHLAKLVDIAGDARFLPLSATLAACLRTLKNRIMPPG